MGVSASVQMGVSASVLSVNPVGEITYRAFTGRSVGNTSPTCIPPSAYTAAKPRVLVRDYTALHRIARDESFDLLGPGRATPGVKGTHS
eukprot:7185562-Pyramimonas_sp.AAC.1